MIRPPRIGYWLRRLERRPGPDEESRRELDFHLEMRTRELVTRGMDADAARSEARRRFGDVARVRRTCRRLAARRNRTMQRTAWLEDIRLDLRFAARQLLRSPGLTIIVVATLGLGIGANSAIFSIVNALLLRPLPVYEPERLVVLTSTRTTDPDPFPSSMPDLLDLRAQAETLEDIAAWSISFVGLDAGGGAERIGVALVTGNYFGLLGVPRHLGRVLQADEGWHADDPALIVLGHGYWQRRFGGDPNVVGRQVTLSGAPATIVGVAPASFTGTYTMLEMDAYVSLGSTVGRQIKAEALVDRGQRGTMRAIARLAPGATIAEAQVELDVVAARLRACADGI